MALPKAIQAQIDESAAIEKVIADGPEALVENTPEPEAPTAAVEKTEHLETPTATPNGEDHGDWKRKYEVLEGKYKAEVPRLSTQIRELTTGMEAMKSQLETVSKKHEAPPQKKESLITPKDQDAFGEDLVDFTKRAAQEVVSEETTALRERVTLLEQAIAKVATLPKQVGEVVEKQALTDEQTFWRDLGTAIPDWAAVDSNPKWIEHLDTKAKYVTATHRKLAEIAVAERNIPAIKELVDDWKVLSGITAQEQTKETNNKELKKQITPNKTSNTTPTTSEPETYTWAEYDAAYDPRASRTLSAAEVEALQAKMETAYQEGRIV